ncbi:MAG: hypothetical protein V7K24_13765 [Nostoc sp.]
MRFERSLICGSFNPLEDANPQVPNNCELPAHLRHHSNVELQQLLYQSAFCQQYVDHLHSRQNAKTRLEYEG